MNPNFVRLRESHFYFCFIRKVVSYSRSIRVALKRKRGHVTILSVTLRWKFCLKLFYYTSALGVRITVLGCTWPGWKWITTGSTFFEFIALCLGKLAKTLIMVYSFFENSLDLFLSVFCKCFMFDKGI